jgi:hypothetical protein
MSIISNILRVLNKNVCPTCNEDVHVVYTDDFSVPGVGSKWGSLCQCRRGHYSVHIDGMCPVEIPTDYSNLHMAYEKALNL